METRIPLVRRFGYGLGDFGLQLFFLTASLYLLFYYTDVLGLDPAVAGWVFAAPLVWDAVTDPLIGAWANKTRSRWGRYRPFLLFTAIPLALSWAFVFFPVGFEGASLVIFAIGAHLVFRTLYGVAAMPYLALSAAMTRSSSERSVLAAFRMISASGAGIFAAFFTPQLVETFGAGDAREGYFRVALLYGAIGAALLILVFATAKEEEVDLGKASPSFAAIWRTLRVNTPFWLVGGALLVGSGAGVFFNKNIPYFTKYVMENERLMGPALGIVTMAITFSIPVWTVVMKKASKRIAFLVGAALAVVGYAAVYVAPPTPGAILPLMALIGIGSGGVYLGTWAMMPDTVEYGEYRTGVRAEGAAFGVVSFLQKATLGLAAGLLGEALSQIGFQPNAAQTPETMDGLRALMFFVPAGCTAAAAALIYFYPLDARRHGDLVEALKARRASEPPAEPS